MSKLPADCLNDIFEYLEEDKVTLRSCLLVNRLWCETAVSILWRNIRNYSTLITCFPNESKEILSENGIIASTAASKPPMFNYFSFCKVLLVDQVVDEISKILKNQQSSSSQNLNNIMQEIFKLLMNQISLKKLEFYTHLRQHRPQKRYESLINIPNFASFPGAKDCLKNLTELYFKSADINPELLYQLSQICHNIQSLSICFDGYCDDIDTLQNGLALADLISGQQNLKHLFVEYRWSCEDFIEDITTLLLKNIPDTLIKLEIYGSCEEDVPFSFVTKLTNLQELIFSFYYWPVLKYFNELEHTTFSHLQVLKFQYKIPDYELLIKFLENNGKNLKEFYVNDNTDYSLNLAIAKFCPNLRKLCIKSIENQKTLIKIFNSCQYLESIKTSCDSSRNLYEKELFKVLAKYSPKNFYELKLFYSAYRAKLELLPEELESFLTSWANRIQQKPFSLIIILRDDSATLNIIDKNMKLIEKYIKLGIIKEYKTINDECKDF